MLRKLAHTMYRRRRWVLAAWIVLLVGAFAIGNAAGGVFRTQFKLPGSESQAAFDLLKQEGFSTRTGEQAQIVFEARPGVDRSGRAQRDGAAARGDPTHR